MKTDESTITGESGNLSKDVSEDPFMWSGTSMAAGTCNMLVTAVGIRSFQVRDHALVAVGVGDGVVTLNGVVLLPLLAVQGRIMADTAMEAKDTPLQEKLEEMATRIGYFGFVFAFLTFIAMVISWFVDNHKLVDDYTTSSYVLGGVCHSLGAVLRGVWMRRRASTGLVRGCCSQVDHQGHHHLCNDHCRCHPRGLGTLPMSLHVCPECTRAQWCDTGLPGLCVVPFSHSRSPFRWRTRRGRC